MKNVFLILSITFYFCLLISCGKECEISNEVCNEQVPENEACLAFFSRWFYSENDDRCTLIDYSGCSERGFASQEDCELCQCN